MDTESTSNEQLLSPQLQALAAAPDTLTAFWESVTAGGAPLVEPIDGDPDHVWVTFLWRATETVDRVAVLSHATSQQAGWSAAENQLTLLSDTDVWYRTYRLAADIRTIYEFAVDFPAPSADEDAFRETLRPDPLNPLTYPFYADDGGDPAEAEVDKVVSLLALPAAPPQPALEQRPTVARGAVTMFSWESEQLANSRRLWVYTPPGYDAVGAERYPLLVMLDGQVYARQIPLATILDNLIAAGDIPPLVAAMVDNIDPETRLAEMLGDTSLGDSLATELVPWLASRYRLQSAPAARAIGGSSAAGVAALATGVFQSAVFGNAIVHSPAVWWKPEDEREYEWLTRRIAAEPTRSVRLWLDAGTLETMPMWDETCPRFLVAVRHLRTVLTAKGYDVRYHEFAGGHDYICWQGTLVPALRWLWG